MLAETCYRKGGLSFSDFMLHNVLASIKLAKSPGQYYLFKMRTGSHTGAVRENLGCVSHLNESDLTNPIYRLKQCCDIYQKYIQQVKTPPTGSIDCLFSSAGII